MSLKDELVLILCIGWHFVVYKMFFSVSLLDSFQQCARNSRWSYISEQNGKIRDQMELTLQ